MAKKNYRMYGVNKVTFPKYVEEILQNVHLTDMPHEFILYGVNQYRPSYGIYKDMEKLIKWAEMNFAEVEIVRYVTATNNYHVKFNMTDPTAFIVEEFVKERKAKAEAERNKRITPFRFR